MGQSAVSNAQECAPAAALEPPSDFIGLNCSFSVEVTTPKSRMSPMFMAGLSGVITLDPTPLRRCLSG
jgi:hypothetical protein